MNVALLGSGLIGGSIGLGLKQADPSIDITAYDRDPATANRAVERGAADRSAPDPAAAVADRDLVFIATPVGAIVDVAREAARAAREGVIFTDVGSTKHRVVVEAEGSLEDSVRFIGGHPMAGTEEDGIDAASADLFRGAWWVLTPTERSDTDAYKAVHGLVTTLGARVLALEPAEHDRLMAIVSHLPQLTATTLMNLAMEQGQQQGSLLALAAGGFRDLTRVAASNPEIWIDICRENREAIVAALTAFSDRILEVRDLLERGDLDELGDRLRAARTARRNLPVKDLAGDLYDVHFPVPDRPGVLAEVTTTVGNLGVNIEHIEITHSAEGGKGTVHLTVVGEQDALRVAAVLVDRGFEARTGRR